MKLSEIREHYFFQLSQKNQVQSALQFPTTLIVLFIGVLILYSEYLRYRIGLLEIMFSLSSIFVALSCFFIIRVLTMYKYEEIADVNAFLKHKADLEEYFQRNPNSHGNPEDDFEHDLTLRYAEAIDTNALMNKRRFSDIYLANRAIIIAGVIIALTLYPYLRQKNMQSDLATSQETTETQRGESDG